MASQNKGRLQIQPTVRAKKKAPCIILGENQGLIVAEVELESENQDFPNRVGCLKKSPVTPGILIPTLSKIRIKCGSRIFLPMPKNIAKLHIYKGPYRN